ncbi:transcriptional Coactivator p15-domain-containing protein [Syncephalis plumigaleata]|nr:transcriptional Coactivator p15-domain-containing protein [Syncephalis plumigaleata]
MSKRAAEDDFVVESDEAEASDDSYTSKPKATEKKRKVSDATDDDDSTESKPTSFLKNAEGDPYFRLGAKKRLTIRKWKQMVLIDFREYFTNAAGEECPTKKGLSLTEEQWKILKASMETIDQAINEMK